jgi:flavin reductase (DIM6/NTAB) family NADH-FMN oxidoreductase RutF
MTLDPKDFAPNKFVGYLQSAVVPRPIAFASTVDQQGNVNLSPFSFFNVFSINPPILIFSPSRRVRDNTTKHTLENVYEVNEVVVNMVNYSMIEQTSLASVEFPKGVNEFEKAGFTAVASDKVKPPRVKESPVSFECKVKQVIPLGDQGGSGNLVICEIILMHIHDSVLNEAGSIDPLRLDAVARMGGDYYCRINKQSIFTVPKPCAAISIGVDQLPQEIRTSKVLTGNDLGRLASVVAIPQVVESNINDIKEDAHLTAHKLIEQNKIEEAWRVLLQASKIS